MNTIFKNSKNSKTSKPYILLLNLTDKLVLKRSDKYVALSNLSIYYTWKNIKKSYNNNKFKISASTWDEEIELPEGSYSASDIQDYFILKTHGENVDNPSVQIYVNKIGNRVTFKTKSSYTLELLKKKTMKFESAESKITKNKHGENVPHLQITEVVLTHSNIVNDDYQQDSRVLHTLVPNKPFDNLLEISPNNHILLKTFNSEYDEIKVWFTDQNSQPLGIEDRINLILIIK